MCATTASIFYRQGTIIRTTIMIRVVDVEPIGDYRLKIRLSDGRQGIFDVTPYLDIGVFRELKDPSYFRCVRAAYGGIVWPHEQDLSPETIEHGLQELS